MESVGPGQTGPHLDGTSIPRRSALNGHKVDRGELASSVDLEVELESVALVDAGQARPLDGADVHESVFLAIVAGDEAEALHRVEELDRAGRLLAGQLALRTGGFLLDGDYVADDLQIGSRDFPAAVDQIEGKLLPLGKPFEAGALNLADVDENVLAAFVTLDEAEALLSVEELDLALAGSDDLRRHAATTGRTAIAAAESAAAAAAVVPAATEAVTTAETVAAAGRAPIVTAAETRRAARKRIETLFPEIVSLVAPPAATSFIVTHEPVVPLLASFPPAALRVQ